MKLDFIDLDKLSIAKTNIRGKGKDPDVADILPSIRARGIRTTCDENPDTGSGGPVEYERRVRKREFIKGIARGYCRRIACGEHKRERNQYRSAHHSTPPNV